MLKLKHYFTNLFFARPCFICQKEQGFSLCRNCLNEALNSKICLRCDSRLDNYGSCLNCAKEFQVHFFRSLFDYAQIKPLIVSIKRDGYKPKLPQELFSLTDFWNKQANIDAVLIPVPASSGDPWFLPWLSKVSSPLERNPIKMSQKLKSASNRLKDSLDLFLLKDEARVNYSELYLIDDVVSTGQSLRVCKELIGKSGLIVCGILTLAYQLKRK